MHKTKLCMKTYHRLPFLWCCVRNDWLFEDSIFLLLWGAHFTRVCNSPPPKKKRYEWHLYTSLISLILNHGTCLISEWLLSLGGVLAKGPGGPLNCHPYHLSERGSLDLPRVSPTYTRFFATANEYFLAVTWPGTATRDFGTRDLSHRPGHSWEVSLGCCRELGKGGRNPGEIWGFSLHTIVKLPGYADFISLYGRPHLITNLHGRKWSSQLYATSVVISVT